MEENNELLKLQIVFYAYLEERNMLKVKLSEVEPKIIHTLMMALRPVLDYLPAASYFLPVLFKDGRIPAYPPDCEILATIMARVLIVSQSTTSTIGDTMFRHL